jgi:hypothetical protein
MFATTSSQSLADSLLQNNGLMIATASLLASEASRPDFRIWVIEAARAGYLAKARTAGQVAIGLMLFKVHDLTDQGIGL